MINLYPLYVGLVGKLSSVPLLIVMGLTLDPPLLSKVIVIVSTSPLYTAFNSIPFFILVLKSNGLSSNTSSPSFSPITKYQSINSSPKSSFVLTFFLSITVLYLTKITSSLVPLL